eukprot:g68085.t1
MPRKAKREKEAKGKEGPQKKHKKEEDEEQEDAVQDEQVEEETPKEVESSSAAKVSKPVKVHITYWCTSPTALKRALEEALKSDVEVDGARTPTTTGAFEVQIVGGPLVHSKLNGDGHLNPTKQSELIAKIKAYGEGKEAVEEAD